METPSISLKIAYGGEIHRIEAHVDRLCLTDLKALFGETFADLPEAHVIQYRDEEGDLITVSNDVEFMESCRVFMRLKGTKTLSYVARATHPIRNQFSPLVKAMEEFAAEIALVTTSMAQKVPTSSELKQKCDELNGSVQEHVVKTCGALKSHSRRLSESECVQQVKDFTHDVRLKVKELMSQLELPTEGDDAFEEDSDEEEEEEEEEALSEVEEDEEEAISTSEVEEDEEEALSTPEVEEVCTETLIEDETEDRKWGVHFAEIQKVFPEVSFERAELLLERFDGDLHVVLNALLDL